jgi:hypothetical protein
MSKPPLADQRGRSPHGFHTSPSLFGLDNRTSVVVAAVLALLLPVLAAHPVDAQTAVTAGYRDFSFGSSVTSPPTGEKPESKLWWNDGTWWGVLFSAGANAYHIYRFDAGSQTWIDTGTAVDTRKNSKSDALWDQPTGRLYVVSHVFTTSAKASTSSSQWGRLFRYTYDSGLRQYVPDSGFPVSVTKGNEEALTLAKDSVQRLWITYVEAGKVKINWSRAHDLDWGSPVDLPAPSTAISVTSDDISAVVAFGGAYIGVMWSNQNRAQTYFAFRNDADLPEVWQATETVLPGPGCSGACADDHFNLKTDQSGRVFAATKTSLSSSTSPLAMLAVRSAGAPATWTSSPIGLQRDHHTRPIVLLDEQNDTVYVFATSGESGGTIYMKSSPLADISFAPGLGTPFIKSASDTTINNATSTKQNVDSTTGLLVAASDQNTHFYLHGYLAGGGTADTPAPPSGLAATAVSSTRVDLTWTDASTDEDSFSIERATSGTAFAAIGTTPANTPTFSDTTAAPGTSYSYRVRARNTAGFSAYSNTAAATTPGGVATTPAAPTGLAATAISGTRVDLTWTDASTDEDSFSIERATGGTAFAAIGTTPANTPTFSDTTAAPGTSYSYRVRAQNLAGFSAYSNTASATTPTDGGGAGSPIKSITFEGGTLTDAATGADKAVGTVSLETASPINGLYSARIPNAVSSYLEENFASADDVYVSMYIRVNALPAADARILLVSDAGTTVGNIVLRTTGRLRLRIDATSLGVESAPLQVGQIYRIGIHQKRGSGGNAVLEAFLATGNASFSTPFASTSTGTWITAADRLRVGATNPNAIDVVIDEVRLDAAAMPGPSGQ